MSELFKEMCSLSGQLSDFIAFIEDKESRRTLLSLQLNITELCRKISDLELDENEYLYWKPIEKILDTERVINSFKNNKIKLTGVIDHVNTIIDNVEKIIGIKSE